MPPSSEERARAWIKDASSLRYLDNRYLSSPDFRYRHENAEEALNAAENILTAAKNIVNSATEIINSRLRNI